MRELDQRSVRVYFEAAANHRVEVDVRRFSIEESLMRGFVADVEFLSVGGGALDFDEVAGVGAAISLRTAHHGERVWAGICTELTLVDTQNDPDSPGNSAMRYRMVIHSALHRLSMRTNSRIFQDKNAANIVQRITAEWLLPVHKVNYVGQRLMHDYKVQYQETDLAFLTRICEEAGFTFRIASAKKIPHEEATSGSMLSGLHVSDAPHLEPETFPAGERVLQFVSDSPRDAADQDPHLWGLTATQRPISGRVTTRGHDFRSLIDKVPNGTARYGGPDRLHEAKYERYSYDPGAFTHLGAADGPTPIADDRGAVRVDVDELRKAPERMLAAEVVHRTTAQFKTDSLELDPGATFRIGKEDDHFYPHNHPHPAFGPKVKLLVTSRRIQGGNGDYLVECTAVLAQPEFRPLRTVPKPRIFGVQSAVVVGPKGKEIHNDEYGRVRVQFDWDREGKYDDGSSCWMRVSQGWAGGGFGSVALPRVGHEVLVGFFEGDPDLPIIVGRVFNAGTQTPYFPLTGRDAFGAHATKTAIRTDTSPHGQGNAGYNELLFQDERGHEVVHVQAQRDLSFVVNAGEAHAVGGDVSFSIGAGEHHKVARDLDFSIGGDESHTVNGKSEVRAQAGIVRTSQADLDLTSKGATHVTAGGVLKLSTSATFTTSADGKVTIDSGEGIVLKAPTLEITVNGASLKMGSDGVTITTGGATLTLQGSTATLEAAGKVGIGSGGPLDLAGKGSVKLGGSMVSIDGADVLLNGGTAPVVAFVAGPAPSVAHTAVTPYADSEFKEVKAGGKGNQQPGPYLAQDTVVTPPETPENFDEVAVLDA